MENGIVNRSASLAGVMACVRASFYGSDHVRCFIILRQFVLPSLRAVADGAAIQSRTKPPHPSLRGAERRGNPENNQTSVVFSGLPRDLWSLAVTGLGKRPELQAALLRGLQNRVAIQSRTKPPHLSLRGAKRAVAIQF